MLQKLICVFLLTCFIAVNCKGVRAEVRTDWLADKVGSQGEILGARVIAVDDEKPFRLVYIEIPEMQNFELANSTIEIFSENEKVHEKRVLKNAQVLRDGEGQSYGMRIKIKKLQGFEFRLYLHQQSDSEQQ